MFMERLPRGSDGLDYCPSLLSYLSMIFVLAQQFQVQPCDLRPMG